MKKPATLILILFVLLMVGLFYSKSLGAMELDYKTLKERDKDGAINNAQAKKSASKPEAIIRPKVEYKAQGLKDPFQALVAEKKDTGAVTAKPSNIKALPVLTLQGLIWRGVFPQAIINNKVVKVGDSIEEAEVVAIEKEGVTILYANRRYTLPSPSVMGPRDEEQIKGGRNEGAY